MQQTTGRAALANNSLPTSKTITGATNATPIVITTSAAHGLHTNEIVRIANVTGNTGANGDHTAVVLSSTTFALTAYAAGTPIAGTGAYTGGGTARSLGWGPTVPVPNDLTDAMRAGTVNVPHEAALDRLAFLVYQTWIANDKYALVPVPTTGCAAAADVAPGGAAVETITATSGIGTASGIFTLAFAGVSVGDVLTVSAAFDAGTIGAGGGITTKIYAIIGASAVPVPGCADAFAAGGIARRRSVMVGSWVAATAGTMAVTLYVSAGVGDTWSNYGTGSMVATLVSRGI